MCGIAGSFRCNVDVAAMVRRLRHRGPDGCGVEARGDAVLGHARLSVRDLTDASAQPFRLDDVVLTYNGEIWNHVELRAAFPKPAWRTTGDTEVVAEVVSRLGAAGLYRFDGMFGLAWHSGEGTFLARDRFGKIPLYWVRVGRGAAWASERKAFPPKLRPLAEAFPPGTVVRLDTMEATRYAAVEPRRSAVNVDELLRRGVERRMVSDAPLCCLISGGLDSSLILRYALNLRRDVVAYTAYADDESCDLVAARRLCRDWGVELREVPVKITLAALEEAAWSIEVASKAQIEIAALCRPLAKQISADGFKVCLSGEASDELFGGYGSMCIKAASGGDEEWLEIRMGQIQKMARGNFVRCNKSFMSYGVECRLPFMDRSLVEHVLSLGKKECPPGKGLLKQVGDVRVGRAISRRQKETFQGAGGSAAIADRLLGGSATKRYNDMIRGMFGCVTRE